MAKLTKEEVQALVRVMGATTYHTVKSTETVSECGGEIRNWVHITHTVEIWYGRSSPLGNVYLTSRARARSRDEDKAWRNAYMKFIKLVENDG